MRRKSYTISGGVAVAAFLAIAVLYLFSQGPDLRTYEFLKEPRMVRMASQKMLVVTAQGDRDAVGNRAFKLLYNIYYKIPGALKSGRQAPRARWAGDPREKSSLTGFYALPVPEGAALPAMDLEPGYPVELTTWEYGDVAEILHAGPYSEETPAIEKLRQFVQQQGYRIAGYQEEEYLKGPGMFFKGDPGKYLTIIRYQVRKVE